MDQFRTASEACRHNPMSPQSLMKGHALGPTGVPAAEAQGPVTHMPILGFDPVHQGWSHSKMEVEEDRMLSYGWISPKWQGPVLVTAHLHFVSVAS